MLVNIANAVQSSNAWIEDGFALISSGEYNEALNVFDKAIEINPQDSMAWNGEGAALTNLDKYDGELIAFD